MVLVTGVHTLSLALMRLRSRRSCRHRDVTYDFQTRTNPALDGDDHYDGASQSQRQLIGITAYFASRSKFHEFANFPYLKFIKENFNINEEFEL